MGLYNAANIELLKIHVLEDENMPVPEPKVAPAMVSELELQKLIDEYTCAEDNYCRIIMDRKDKFCKEQVLARKEELD